MSAMPKPEPPQRRKSMYEDVMEQLVNLTEERIAANLLKIERTIGLYERVYGRSSEEMRRKLAAGEIEETYEICCWSQEVSLLEDVLKDRR